MFRADTVTSLSTATRETHCVTSEPFSDQVPWDLSRLASVVYSVVLLYLTFSPEFLIQSALPRIHEPEFWVPCSESHVVAYYRLQQWRWGSTPQPKQMPGLLIPVQADRKMMISTRAIDPLWQGTYNTDLKLQTRLLSSGAILPFKQLWTQTLQNVTQQVTQQEAIF